MTAITERYLQDQIRKLCKELGLTVQHIERADLAGAWLPGWPDLVIFGDQRVNFARPAILYRELKGPHGIVPADQRIVGRIIQAAGGDWAVWYPRDLLSGRIARELTAIS